MKEMLNQRRVGREMRRRKAVVQEKQKNKEKNITKKRYINESSETKGVGRRN